MAKKKVAPQASNNDILEAIKGLTAAILSQKATVEEVEEVVATKKKIGRPKKTAPKPMAKVGPAKRPKHASGTQVFAEKRTINLFEEMEEFHSCKEDTKEDKKKWRGKKPTPRRPPTGLVEIQCTQCHNDVEVSPKLVVEASTFVCNNCQVGKGKR